MNKNPNRKGVSPISADIDRTQERYARSDRIKTKISRGLTLREQAASIIAEATEKPVAIYFGLDKEASAEFCLWMMEYLLRDLNELFNE